MSKPAEDQQDPSRIKLLKKCLPSVMKEGFQQLKMDDIAKYMDVSRATMYKHFSSKEEIVEGIVRIFVDYIEQLEDPDLEDDDMSFGVWFQRLFEQSISLIDKISDVFLKDLHAAYPDLYELLKGTLNRREQRTLQFYQFGKDKGIFNQINEKFILLQDELLLRELLNVKYLLHNQATIQQVLYDYYEFKKIQLFKTDKLSVVDDANIRPVIDHIVEKFNRAL